MSWPLQYMGELTPDYDQDQLKPGQLYSIDREKFMQTGENAGYHRWPAQLAKNVSEYYKQHNSHRLPVMIVLPTLGWFCLDSMCYSHDQGGYYGGWTVTGRPEDLSLTVSPSINIGSTWHGWVQNGVMTDDCEGRTYDSAGQIKGQTIP